MYIAPKGKTHNLMDYTTDATATNLRKYQWDYIHNPENIVGIFEDDSEGESVSIPDLLKSIRQANLDYKKIITIMQDGCPENAYKDVSIGDKKLRYFAIHCTDNFETIPTEPQTTSFVDWNLNDESNEVNVIPSQRNTIEYETTLGTAKLYQFFEAEDASPPLLYNNSDNLLFEFVILKEDADKFEDYLYATWEKLLQEDELTASEIAIVRSGIAKVVDENQRGEYFLELQTKVPYESQLINSTKPYVTCNQTSLSMCLEGLGIVNPDSDMSFADYLENLRVEKMFGSRTQKQTRIDELLELGANYEEIPAIDKNFSLLKEKLLPYLRKGDMVTFSMGNHIVRLVEFTDEGIVVDDPYGCLSCKDDLVSRQDKMSNVYCNSKGHASCCNATTAYKSPCKTNSISNMSNTPGKDCFWSKESVNELNIYNILIVKP